VIARENTWCENWFIGINLKLKHALDLLSISWPTVVSSFTHSTPVFVLFRDGKETSKNEPNQNPGFAMNFTQTRKWIIRKNPNQTLPWKDPNRTRIIRLQNSNRTRTYFLKYRYSEPNFIIQEPSCNPKSWLLSHLEFCYYIPAVQYVYNTLEQCRRQKIILGWA